MGDVAQAEGHGDEVETVIREGQRFDVGDDKFEVFQPALVGQALLTDFQHGGVDVGGHQPSFDVAIFTAHPFRETQGDVAGTGSEVEDVFARFDFGLPDIPVLPHAVDAGAHHVIHQIVFGGDGIEHVGDAAFLFLAVDGFVAEVGLLFLCHRVSRVLP